jgi:hypothetical protein
MDFAAKRPNASYLSDQRFFTRLALALATLIVFGFLQWALRGFVDPLKTPIWVHLHGLAMLGWLGTIVVQNRLAEAGNLSLHRRLGWASLGLVLGIVVLGMLAGRRALALHRVPPFFTDAYFLALTHVEVIVFAAVVTIAISLRKETQWHRRLMLGATVILMEPALGRLLPMPLLGQAFGGWLEAGIQIGFLAILVRHDVKVLGRVHPATLIAMCLVIGVHALIQILAGMPGVIMIAEAIARGSGAA